MHEKENKDFTAIGAELKLAPRTVLRNYRQVAASGDPYHYGRSTGRPPRFTERDKHHATKLIDTGEARDGSDVQRLLFPDAPSRTARHMLQEIGLNGRIRRTKPLLSKSQIEKRKNWAADMLELTADDWRDVWFPDKSKFNLFGSDGKQYCRRRVGEELLPRNVKKTVKHGGGSIMVWGCLTPNGAGRLHRVQGKMNAAQFCDILDESLLGTLSDHSLQPSDIVFQQDSDPKHTSRHASNWFHDHDMKILRWAPSSPDMNIIEHAWDELDHRIRARNVLPQNTDQLWAALQEEWAKLDMAYINKLYDSMPRRVQALYDAEGAYTKY
jgi:hypothetical protein